MNQEQSLSRLFADLFEQWSGEKCEQQLAIGANGSNRKYVRLRGKTRGCMAAYNDDVRENEAFIYYSRHFYSKGLPVPLIYAVSDDKMCYLQEDLGDTTLYGYMYEKRRAGDGFDSEMFQLYRMVLDDLVRFQTECRDLDFSYAYPRSDFDRQSMQWDLNYFKYYFLKLAYIPFDEQLLEADFHKFEDYLLDEYCGFFMYRDFQARNIMLCEGKPYYIDYQGGRRGAAQYDVASLLYSAKSDIPEPIRQDLLNYYIGQLSLKLGKDKDAEFRKHFLDKFYAYVMARIMQAMGAYGYRGYFERKDYFLNSIPLAVRNLRLMVENHPIGIEIPHLQQVWNSIIEKLASDPHTQATIPSDKLTVKVSSFSYKKGLPVDDSGNGGGFVFDCRALPNPGRYPEYKSYTGKDQPVIDFLKKEPAVDEFLLNAEALVGQSVKKYIERNFSSLMVSFGCTGGQHRSVYCAEKMAQYISENFDCHIVLKHREQD